MIKISKNLYKSPLTIDPSTLADPFRARGFNTSGHTHSSKSALEPQIYRTQVIWIWNECYSSKTRPIVGRTLELK
jgi:hypothetical protein